MAEDRLSKSSQPLTLVLGKLRFGVALFAAPLVLLAVLFFTDMTWATLVTSTTSLGEVAVVIFLVCMLDLAVRGQWIAEIDPATGRLRIFKHFAMRWRANPSWSRIFMDCSFDECSALGTVQYNDDRGIPYGLYVEFKRGGQYDFPLQGSTLSEAAKVAAELSAATGIPVRDTV
jgi:hypothetical protein